MCLRAYDKAKHRAGTPTAFEHVLSDTALAKRPDPFGPMRDRIDSSSEPLPEAATVELLLARAAWEEVLQDAKSALDAAHREYDRKGLDPQAPCPDDLAVDYKRVFRAQTTVHSLTTIIDHALAGHMLRPNEMPPWILNFYGKAPAKDVARHLRKRKGSRARRT
jgi:hypothetical protein